MIEAIAQIFLTGTTVGGVILMLGLGAWALLSDFLD